MLSLSIYYSGLIEEKKKWDFQPPQRQASPNIPLYCSSARRELSGWAGGEEEMELVSEEVERTNEITADWLHGSERASEREQEWERKKMTKFLLTDLLLFLPRPSGKMDTQRSKERKKARGRETRKDPFPPFCCQLRKYLSLFFPKYIYRLVPVGWMSQEVSLRKNEEKAMIVITSSLVAAS